MAEPSVHIFGVRHHGPGSARSLVHALGEIKPKCVLIEGPPDADEVIEFAARAQMRPPVAILVHAAETPQEAVYYPFAEFSPEWQAIRWAQSAGVPVRFMDLPQWHRMAIDLERRKAAEQAAQEALAQAQNPPAQSQDPPTQPAAAEDQNPEAPGPDDQRYFDPLGELARAAGFDDGERWWEHVVEHQPAGDAGMFAAIRDAMGELRKMRTQPLADDEPHREAWMRKTIREAKKDGFERIAVVCGAWHAPVLDVDAISKKEDDQTLGGLPKIKTAATWIPWTHDRLTYASGYGAGVHSPGWYEHLWQTRQHIVEQWMTRVANLLRSKDIDCSSAHVIEAVRLSATLATLRGRPLPDLSDIADSTRTVFCFDSDLPMQLIARELLVGHRLGELPDDVPMVPLQQDLTRLQKSLRLKPEALERTLDLDLRNDTDRQRSHLLHRLRLLEIDWGTPQQQGGGKGTFHEIWALRWEPTFAVKLIEAGVLGTTIEQAAGAKLRQLASRATGLKELAGYLHDAMLAELGEATAELVRQIENAAAVAADVALLMDTLPQLASLVRYGNVRQTDQTLVRDIVSGIVPRVIAGLDGAVSSLNDDAATEMEQRLRRTHAAIELLENPQFMNDWVDCLRRILDHDTVHGLVRGRCARLLLDAGKLASEQIAQRLSLTLSRGNEPAQGARWLEGFLSGSGLLLIHDEKLLGLIDAWMAQIDGAIFQELVPLLRRTFATFPAGERRQIGQMLHRGRPAGATGAEGSGEIDRVRAERALPLLKLILGSGA